MYIYELYKDPVTNRPYLVHEDDVKYDHLQVNSCSEVVKMFNNCFNLKRKCVEEAVMLVLAADNSILGLFKISTGTVDRTVLDTRSVFQKIFMLNGASFIVAHNHPSGNPEPSEADLLIARRLKDGGDLMNVQMLDFMVIGNEKYYSFKEEELI